MSTSAKSGPWPVASASPELTRIQILKSLPDLRSQNICSEDQESVPLKFPQMILILMNAW